MSEIEVIHIESDNHWHELRAGVVGSSDVSCLFGLSTFKTYFTLWHEKAGNYKQEVSSSRIDAGNHLENAIGQMVCAKIGGQSVVKSKEFYRLGRLGATPDFFIHMANGKTFVLEVKNMDFIQFREKCPDGVPPKMYILQLMHQMHCTGIYNGILAILVGGNDLKVFPYVYRSKIGVTMQSKAEALFCSIQCNEAPDVSDASDLCVIRSIYENDNRHIDLSLDNEAVAMCHDLNDATEKRKHYAKIEDISKARLISKMSGYNTAEIGSDFKVSITHIEANNGVEITPDMVGQVINARKASLRLNIKKTEG